MTSKSKSLAKLMVSVILIAFLAYVAFFGVQIGSNFVGGALKTDKSGIKLGFDLSGGSVLTYEADASSVSDSEIKTAINMLQTRLTNLGYTEATVTKQGDKKIRIEIPDVSNDEAIEKLGTPGVLTFRNGEGQILMEGSKTYVKDASPEYSTDNGYFVQLQFTKEGQDKFAEATGSVYGSSDPRLYIYLDEEVQSAPTVQQVINSDSCVITGDFDSEQANWLANTIKEGQMPFKLVLKSTSSVSPTLGDKAMSTSMTACGIGIVLVLLFMLIFYRVPGFIADLALVAYTAIVLLILTEFESITGAVINLTLPGIAGIVLGIGMAVDANVIIFERIKDELKSGRTVGASIESGFKRAFSAILDGNVTTIIAAVVLYIFGTGTIQGFAVTLGLGIVVSMFTAIVVTRFMLKALIGLDIRNPKLYGASLRGGKENA